MLGAGRVGTRCPLTKGRWDGIIYPFARPSASASAERREKSSREGEQRPERKCSPVCKPADVHHGHRLALSLRLDGPGGSQNEARPRAVNLNN